MNTRKWLIILATLILCMGIGLVTTPAFAQLLTDCTAQADGTLCDDGDPCSVGDICTGGVCAGTAALVCTFNNNFTMQDGGGSTPAFGGTNDVTFAWDGTLKTSVATSGQVPNASLFSPCNFFSHTWQASDVAIYGPGIYTVYTNCPGGSPGCGSGASYTFTVMQGQLGAHMLYDWNGNPNIDVVDIWDAGQPYGPYSGMWDGSVNSGGTGCATNPASTV